jgi:glycosyltransferase involved in cell wall biosynthesis
MFAGNEPVLRDEDEIGMLSFMGFHMPLDGYGYATMRIARQLQRIEPGVQVIDMRKGGPLPASPRAESAQGEESGFGQAGDREWNVGGNVIALCTPDWLPYIHADRLIAYTMFEATKLPAGWADSINANAQACLVPSAWCAEVFVHNGVRVPIEVVMWGIDPDDYWLMERNPQPHPKPHPQPLSYEERGERPYTFLWSGTADRRKGWDVAYRAFCLAFGHNRRVRLHLHFRDPLPANPRFGDPNVQVTIGKFDRPDLRAMLADADFFVFPSRGEGWGSPPREAAATGLPVLATNYGGLAEEIERWGFPIGIDGMSPAEYGWWDDIGEWAEPSIEQTVELMHWCFERQTEAREFGREAAMWLREHATFERTAVGLLSAVYEGVR